MATQSQTDSSVFLLYDAVATMADKFPGLVLNFEYNSEGVTCKASIPSEGLKGEILIPTEWIMEHVRYFETGIGQDTILAELRKKK